LVKQAKYHHIPAMQICAPKTVIWILYIMDLEMAIAHIEILHIFKQL